MEWREGVMWGLPYGHYGMIYRCVIRTAGRPEWMYTAKLLPDAGIPGTDLVHPEILERCRVQALARFEAQRAARAGEEVPA